MIEQIPRPVKVCRHHAVHVTIREDGSTGQARCLTCGAELDPAVYC